MKVPKNRQSPQTNNQAPASELPLQTKRNAAENLSGVNIHTHSEQASAVGARAFAQGNNVHFAPGEYQPNTSEGKQVLGHELAHVVQQRQGRVSPTNQIGGLAANTRPSLEQEADQMGNDIMKSPFSPANVTTSAPAAASGGVAQMLFGRRKKMKYEDTEIDATGKNKDAIAKGAINQVDMVTYKHDIGPGQKTGFFKEDMDEGDPGVGAKAIGIDHKDPRLANRALASSKVADMLTDKKTGQGPGRTITATKAATHNGKKGTVSEGAKGVGLKSMKDRLVDKATSEYRDVSKDFSSYTEQYRKGDISKGEDASDYYKIDDLDYYQDVNFENPETQKGMMDLQLMDAITGQIDRHGANIFVDKSTGSVQGIDNDAAFGKKVSDPSKLKDGGAAFDPMKASHNKGLPPMIDDASAKKVLDMSEVKFRTQLLGVLKFGEINAAVKRLRHVKKHIKQLYATQMVVGAKDKKGKAIGPATWDKSTFDTILAAGDKNSYLAHQHKRLTAEKARGPQYAENGVAPAAPGPVAPAAPLAPSPDVDAIMGPSAVADPISMSVGLDTKGPGRDDMMGPSAIASPMTMAPDVAKPGMDRRMLRKVRMEEAAFDMRALQTMDPRMKHIMAHQEKKYKERFKP